MDMATTKLGGATGETAAGPTRDGGEIGPVDCAHASYPPMGDFSAEAMAVLAQRGDVRRRGCTNLGGGRKRIAWEVKFPSRQRV